MKKIFFCFTALVMAFAFASCQKGLESTSEPAVELETITFNVSAPGAPQTKTTYGETVNFVPELKVAVYLGGKNTSGKPGTFLKDVVPVVTRKSNTEWSVSINLVKNFYYDIVFWAHKPGAPYAIDWNKATVTANYAVAANDITRDAFYFVCKDYNYVEDQTTPVGRDIKLVRPFAQINVGASDFSELLAFYEFVGKKETDLKTTVTSATVSVPSVLQLLTGEAGTPAELEFVSAPVSVDGGYDLTASANDIVVSDATGAKRNYTLVSTNYIFANTEKPQNPTVDMTLTFEYNGQSFYVKAPSVPYARNFQTNLLGRFFTEDVEFEVVVVPGFKGDKNQNL